MTPQMTSFQRTVCSLYSQSREKAAKTTHGLCAVVLAVIMMLLTFFLGMRRFPAKSPPVAGNSSAAISAACHPGVYEEKAAFMGLKWACISSWPDGAGHCSFAVAKDEDGMGVPMEEVHEGIRYK